MGIHQVPGSTTQVWKGKAWPTGTGAAQLGQRNLLRGALRLRLEIAAQRLWPVADRLWLLPALESGLDVDFHSRHPARLRPKNRSPQGGTDRGHYRQPIGQDRRASRRTRLRRGKKGVGP